jgi:hypothetical protein
MKKLSLLIACFTLPLAALAADGQAAQAPAQAATPVAKSASDSHAAVRKSKAISSRMGACRQDATARNLTGEEFKTAVATCMQ